MEECLAATMRSQN